MTPGEERVSVVATAAAESFKTQIDWCARMDSPMYADLLRTALVDMRSGGATLDVVGGFEGNPTRQALPLRFLGGVHRLVLAGRVPELAEFYPSVGGTPADGMEAAFLAAIADHPCELASAIKDAPQTNEVGRCAALLPGLANASSGKDLPVHLLEIGSAGGLNLMLDRYRYEMGGVRWGNPNATVLIRSDWSGPRPELFESLHVVGRRGCDIAPVDVTNDDERTKLLSFVWADQVERFDRTRAAIDLARSDPPPIDRADAGEWAELQLTDVRDGVLTVLQHSIMWQYMSVDAQLRVRGAIDEAGSRATASAPFAHVRFEPAPEHYEAKGHILTVTTWPGGVDRILGQGHAHGTWFEWFDTPAPLN